MSVRVYQLSKDLGISNQELIQILQKKGFDIHSASGTIPDFYAEDLIKEFKSKPKSAAPKSTRASKSAESAPKRSTENKEKTAEVSTSKKTPTKKSVAPVSVVESSNKVKEKASDVEPQQKPLRMIPLERLQSSINAQNRRLNNRYAGASGVHRNGNNYSNFSRPAFGRNESRSLGGTASGRILLRGEGSERPQAQQRRMRDDASYRTTPTVKNAFSSHSTATSQRIIGEDGSKILKLRLPIAVRELAPLVDVKPFQMISQLMRMGVFASMNYLLEEEIARKLLAHYGYQLEVQQIPVVAPAPAPKKTPKVSREAVLEPRAPIVCVLGHVDHGKTTLLDAFRKTNVVAGEAGGITQHIGAYEVLSGDQKVTFIDTPGHAAFSKMRERGANITDVAILIVAADDGFMPQTDEALKFAKKAGVPVVVAINKIDAKGANIDRVKQQMQQRGITSEDWGGETLCCGISALKGQNLDELLQLVLLQAEMLELKADPKAPVEGVVIESQIEIGRGPTTSVIIQSGTLKVGDALVSGQHYCKVRGLMDDKGKSIKSAGPSSPVKIMGWSGTLEPGAIFHAAANEKEARRQAEENRIAETKLDRSSSGPVLRGKEGLDALFAAIDAKQKKTLRVLIRADVQGSAEALVACLSALPQEKVSLEILQSGVGSVLKSDVEFAHNSGATILAFNTKPENGVAPLLKRYGINLIQHNIIYELIDQVRDAMADLLDPEIREEKLGAAQVRQVFELSKMIIAGCMVTEGKVSRDANARLLRKGKVVVEGKIGSLRRGKDDASEVRAGFECGMSIAGFEDYQTGDVIECYQIQKIRASL